MQACSLNADSKAKKGVDPLGCEKVLLMESGGLSATISKKQKFGVKIAFQALPCASVYEKIYLWALTLCNGCRFNAGMELSLVSASRVTGYFSETHHGWIFKM